MERRRGQPADKRAEIWAQMERLPDPARCRRSRRPDAADRQGRHALRQQFRAWPAPADGRPARPPCRTDRQKAEGRACGAALKLQFRTDYSAAVGGAPAVRNAGNSPTSGCGALGGIAAALPAFARRHGHGGGDCGRDDGGPRLPRPAGRSAGHLRPAPARPAAQPVPARRPAPLLRRLGFGHRTPAAPAAAAGTAARGSGEAKRSFIGGKSSSSSISCILTGLVGTELILRLRRRDDAEIVLGVLQIVLCQHRIAGRSVRRAPAADISRRRGPRCRAPSRPGRCFRSSGSAD